jgi:hypothetical protein
MRSQKSILRALLKGATLTTPRGNLLYFSEKGNLLYQAAGKSTVLIPEASKDWSIKTADTFISLNGQCIPAPEDKAPPLGTTYYVPEIRGELVSEIVWGGNSIDSNNLLDKFVHLTKETAVLHAKILRTIITP